MAVAEQQVAAMELEKVISKIQIAFERDDKFYATIEKRPVEKISNRLMRIPLELRPGGSFQYFNPDGGDLGRGGGPTWDKAVINSVFMSENIEYTKLAQWSTDSDRKAIAQAVRKLTSSALLELRRQLDAQMMQDGTGSIGTVLTDTPAGGQNVIVLTSDFGARLMRYDQTVQVYDATLTTLKGSGKVVQWDVANKTVNLAPQVPGVAPTDVLVTAGITSPTSFPALLGVPYHHNNASTGTWLGFSRSTTPEIRSNRVNASGAGLSLPLPRLLINAIGNRVGIDNDFQLTAWMHPAQAHAYEQIGQLLINISKQPKGEGLDMYFGENMQLAGAKVKCSFNWNTSRIDFVNSETWGRAEMIPVGFYKSDGRSIFEIRGASGGVATAEIFYMVAGFNTFVNNPAATGYISDLAVPVGY